MDVQKSNNLEALMRYQSLKGKIGAIGKGKQISSIVQDYFSSDQLTLSYEQVSLFEQSFYKEKITSIYESWQKTQKNAKQYHLDQFLRFWINNDEKLKLIYAQTEQISSQKSLKKQNKGIPSQQSQKQKTEKALLQEGQQQEQKEEKGQENQQYKGINQNQETIDNNQLKNSKLSSISKPKTSQNQKQQWQIYLQKYYKHFCSLILKTPKGSTFDSIRQLFSTMNLTQWISFCKFMKFTKYHSEETTLTSIALGKIFQKFQEKNKRFIYMDFKEAIFHVLHLIFKEQQVKTKGFQFIGIDSEEAFNEKMKALGVKVSEHKVFFKSINKTIHRNTIKQKRQKQRQGSDDKNDSKIQVPSKIKYYRTRQQKKQSQIFTKLNLENLNKLKINDNMEKKLKNLTMGTDNYLKKYGKIKKPQRNNFNEKNGVIERMDKRMNNVITKIR